jgi:hypothetical protein
MNNASRVTGWWVFAGILLALAGFLDIVWGIAAISNSKFFAPNATYIVSSLHTYGWATLIIGIIQLLAGFSLFSGGSFGRVIGIIAAALSAIAALGTTNVTPLWSLAIFALAIIVIYELAKSPERA